MKKYLMILITLIMMISCTAAQAASHGAHYVCGEMNCTHVGTAHSGSVPQWTEWSGGSFSQNSIVYCYLTDDVEVSSAISIPVGAKVHLCLNGYNVIQKGTGHVFNVRGSTTSAGGTLTICDCTSLPGTIGHSQWGTSGYGVYLAANSTFNLYNGTITNNNTGVYTTGNSATINIYGGDISDNEDYGVRLNGSSSTLNMYGGSIYYTQNYEGVYISSAANMNMSGGSITSNSGGVKVDAASASVRMSGGMIKSNYATNGGGVYLAQGTFSLSGGEIKWNTANRGGGVYVAGGTFSQTGGTISANGHYAGGDFGGGVYLNGGSYTLSGGSIADNDAMVSGGGIYCNTAGALKITGGEIINNNARQSAGGVYANGLSITGDGAKVTGNSVGGWYSSNEVTQERASNIYLPTANQTIELGNGVDVGEFGITCGGVSSYPHPFLKYANSAKNMDRAGLSMFTADDPALYTDLDSSRPLYGVLVQNAEHSHMICGTLANETCTHAQDRHYSSVKWTPWDGTYMPRLTSGNTYLYLTQDNADAAQITVENGQRLYLCLNGHNLIRPGNNLVTISIQQGGEMILCDCAEEGSQGMVSNNYASSAQLISNSEIFTMYGGRLANSNGPAIVCQYDSDPVVNLYGGSITNNIGGYAGGGNGCGVYMRFGTLNMYGGSITNNGNADTNGQGGGVWLGDTLYGAVMNMYGGTISGNSLTGANSKGGGIYVPPRGELNLYGGAITGNRAAVGGGVMMDKSSTYGSRIYVQGNVNITGNTGGNLKLHAPFVRTGLITGNIGVTVSGTPTESAPINFASFCSDMTETELACFTSDQGYTNKRVQGDYAQFYVPQRKHTLTVVASPAAGGTVTGAGSYVAGEAAQLTAAPNSGYRFERWEVTDGSGTFVSATSEETSFTVGTEDTVITAVFAEIHSHSVCGDASCAAGDHSAHAESIIYTPWDGTTDLDALGSRNVVLTANVEGSIRVTGNLNLCLNGFTLSEDNLNTIAVSGGTLNLCDCQGSGKLTSASENYLLGCNALSISGGTANLYGIHIDDCVNNGAISMTDGSLYMYGGSLSNNTCHHDGGVMYLSDYNDTTNTSAYFYGVNVYDNDNSYDDGYANIRMDGGRLTIEQSYFEGNKSTSRGAIALYYDANASIRHTSISGTETRWGGAVSVLGNDAVLSAESCTIMRNNACDYGGIYVEKGTLNLSGVMNVKNNAYNGVERDVYLENGALAVLADGSLPSGSNVGICVNGTVGNGSAVPFLKRADGDVTEADLAAFFSNQGHEMNIEDGLGVFGRSLFTITFANTGDTAIDPITAKAGTAITAPENPTKEGYVFAGWEPELPATMPAQDLTLTALWTVAHSHLSCGWANCTDGGHDGVGHANVVYVPYEVGMTLEDGMGYYLTEDLRTTRTITIPAGKTVYFCLNGKYLYGNGSGSPLFDVRGSLILTHCGNLPSKISVSDESRLAQVIGGTLELHRVNLQGTETYQNGAGVYVSGGGSFIMHSGTMTACKADSYDTCFGGAVYCEGDGSSFVMHGGTISDCEADYGGAVYGAAGTSLTMTGGIISNNTSTGAISLYNGASADIKNVTFTGNVANRNVNNPASAINVNAVNTSGTSLQLEDCVFEGNSNGPTIYVSRSYRDSAVVDATIDNCVIRNNAGSGLMADYAQVNVTGGQINNNSTGYGAGIYAYGNSRVTATDVTISGNTAEMYGGGVYVDASAAVTLDSCTIENNKAESYSGGGGGVFQRGVLNLTGSTRITQNKYNGYRVNDVQLNENRVITLPDGALTIGSSVGVYVPGEVGSGSTVPFLERASGDVTQEDLAAFFSNQGYEMNIEDGQGVFGRSVFTITFVDTGDTAIDPITAKYGTAIMLPEAPTKMGYTFFAWQPEFPETMPAEDLTLTAQWVPEQYTIIFVDAESGNTIEEITLDYGAPITAPENPTREGYTFAGWDAEIPATMPAENLTFTAQWTINQYTLTFDTDGGSVVAPITADFGVAITAPENPTKEGYVFADWQPELPATMPAQDLTLTAQWAAAHMHLACGGESCTDDGHDSADHVAVTYEPYVPGMTLEDGKGYYLTEDTDIENSISIPSGSTVYFCLNGKMLTKTTTGKAYDVSGILILCDCVSGGVVTHAKNGDGSTLTGVAVNVNGGALHMYGGSISGNASNGYGGGVYVYANGLLSMYGGNISGNTAVYGGGVYISNGIVTTYGGSISANAGRGYGGGVYVSSNSALTMRGGKINSNTVDGWGAGVFVNSTGSLTMYNGEISNNMTGSYGGGVYVYDGALNMHGGEICDNTSNGVYMSGGVLTMTGGEIRGNTTNATVGGGVYHSGDALNLSGKVVIEGNTANGNASDIYKNSEEPITLTNGTLEPGSCVGVHISAAAGNGNAVPFLKRASGDVTEADLLAFFSNQDYEMNIEEGLGVFGRSMFTLTFADTGETPIEPITAKAGTALTAPETPMKSGYTFFAWQPEFPETMPAEDLTLTAQWVPEQYTIIFVDAESGNTIEEITLDYGAPITAPENPTREGYTFAGWDAEVPATMPAENLTFTAQWTINQYTITFDTDGGSVVDPITADFGAALTAPENPTKEGCVFAGWQPELPQIMPAEDLTLTAQWTAAHMHLACGEESCTDVDHTAEDHISVAYIPYVPGMTLEDGKGYYLTEDTDIENYIEILSRTTVYFCLNGKTLTRTTEGEVFNITGLSGTLVLCDCGSGGVITHAKDANGNTVKGSGILMGCGQLYMHGGIISGNVADYGGGLYVTDGTTTINGGLITGNTAAEKGGGIYANFCFVKMNGGEISGNTAGKSGGGVYTERGSLWMNDGEIRDNAARQGGGVYVYRTSLKMNGGEICANTSTHGGGGVHAYYEAAVEMNGGLISGNMSDGNGGGVNVNYGAMTMCGGEISGNAAANTGGGVYLSTSSMNMGGGKISGNTASSGAGGVYADALTLDGGNIVIEGNTVNGSPADTWIRGGGFVTLTNGTLDNGSRIGVHVGGEVGNGNAVPFLKRASGDVTQEDLAAFFSNQGYELNIEDGFGVFGRSIFTITFADTGDTAIDPITAKYGTALTAPDVPTKAGYTFDGWYPEFPETMPAQDRTLMARWNVQTHTLTFVDTDGSYTYSLITADYGVPITPPENPTKVGYTFAGWDAEVPATMPAEDMTFTALWTINQYTITFDTDGGSEIDPITADFGTAITAPENPTKTGCTFVGWTYADSGNGSLQSLPTTMPAYDLAYKAVWKQHAAEPMFDGYASGSVTEYDRSNDLTVSWSASDAQKYYVKAFLLNEVPSGSAGDQLEQAVKVFVNDGMMAQNSMTILADDLEGGKYLKLAVGAVSADEDVKDAHWNWIGFELKSTLKIVTQPVDVSVPNGAIAEVKVEAQGDGLTYKWYYKNSTMKLFAYTSAFTGDTYSVEMTKGRSGRQLYCIVNDQYGNSVQTDTVTLSMGNSLEIIKQPVDVTVPNGALAEVKVEAQGEGLTYKWYYKNATMKQFAFTSAFTGDTYSVEMTQGRSGRQLYCIVSDQYGNSVQTDTVTLSMGNSLEIIKQPVDVSVPNGALAEVKVEAQGEGLTYKWYYKNPTSSKFVYSTAIIGNTYTVEMTQGRSGRQLYCIVSDRYGNSVQTDTVTISLANSLEIIKQPVDVSVPNGALAEVTVEAQGEGLTYKWYYKNPTSNKFVYSTAITGNIYTVEMTQGRSGRQLYCIVSDQYGNSVQTDTVTISLANSLEITKQPEDVIAAAGETVNVTVEAQGEGLTYKWYYKNATSSKFVYSSATVGNTYSVEMTKGRSGRQLYCIVSDQYGNSVQTDTVVIWMGQVLTITQQPTSVMADQGSTATVTVTAEGDGLTYAWYEKNRAAAEFAPVEGQEGSSYSAVMDADVTGRQVYCVVTDEHGNSVQTDIVTLLMTGSVMITRQPASVVVYEGQTAEVSFDAIGEGLTYKWYFKNSSSTKFSYTSTFASNTYSVIMNATRSGRQVYCVITDKYGVSVRTDTVTLSMLNMQKASAQGTAPAHHVSVTTDYTNEDIPQTLVDAGFETVEKIEAALSRNMEAAEKELCGKQLYNAELLYMENGVVRAASAAEDFPEGGKVTVEMPVPEESDPMKHRYVVRHMYGMDAFGQKAGGIETCEASVVYGDGGRAMIRFETTGLSPVMVGWTLQDFEIDLPPTGDNSKLVLWAAMLGAVCAIFALRRRK